jgi:hypothetical protein
MTMCPQFVEFDEDRLNPAAETLENSKDCFWHANDINCFPEEDAESAWVKLCFSVAETGSLSFRIGVQGCSGIGSGQIFRGHVGKGSF